MSDEDRELIEAIVKLSRLGRKLEISIDDCLLRHYADRGGTVYDGFDRVATNVQTALAAHEFLAVVRKRS